MSTPAIRDHRQNGKVCRFAAWHKEVIAELEKDFSIIDALMEAERRTAYLGLKLLYVKMRGKADLSIPHGQFQKWVADTFPKVPERSVRYCMAKAKSICERMGWKLESLPEFSTPPHQLLIGPSSDLSAKAQKEKQLLLELVEMRSDNFQPDQQYKQFENGKVKHGRLKGTGGATKAQRLAAIEAGEKKSKEQLDLEAELVTTWLLENGDALHMGLCDLKRLWKLREACQYASGFIGRLEAGRHGGAQ